MTKTSKQKNIVPVVLSGILFILTIFTYQMFISDKYYPFTFVGSTNISFLTQGQAIRKLQTSFNLRAKQQLQFTHAQELFTIDIATSMANLDYSALSTALSNRTTKIYPKVSLSLDKQLNKVASSVDKSPQDATLDFNDSSSDASPSAQIQIKMGVDGIALDKQTLEEEVAKFLLTGLYNMQLPIKIVLPKITTSHVLKAKEALESTLKDPIKLNFGSDSWIIDTKQLLTLLDLTSGEGLLFDKEKTLTFIGKIADSLDQPVQEGLFEFNPESKKVSAFKPSQEGRKLSLDKTYQMLSDALVEGERNINLPVDIIKPKIQTSDVNSLGIKELLGRGISNFAGSIPNRIYNVNLTAQKINGVLIPPGEIFSFNQTVGDITAATGFKQAYVIKEGRTVLDDGGGVCQDSTTLFRAVLNAGLPVVKRTAHAYRVGYYEQGFPAGLDATVFYPSVDFQFKNDTPTHILIQAYTAGTALYVDLYGTSDGRVAHITKSIVTNQTPPPPELRQDDPTLPQGTIKQVDFPAWGATVTFSRTVTRGAETLIKETFKSNYKSWQAVYLVGTKD